MSNHDEAGLSDQDIHRLAELDIADATNVNDEMIRYGSRLLENCRLDVKDARVAVIAAVAVTAYQFPFRNLGQAYGELVYREVMRRNPG